MKIKFFNVQQLDRNLKATVHQTGKTGFTIEASDKMALTTEKSISIGMNEDDETDTNLYAVVNPDKRSDSFNVLKAGLYYYINTKPLFKTLKVDYEKGNIVYEITKDEIDGTEVFVFKQKEKDRKQKEETE
ncbi:hypothetical protein [Mucilaginibacter sp.]|uniref:hypothetical protein n=1 Tax=Mucilaginibacter sp. TaxID=1882438 RepID=UPI003D09B63A